jgi:hypothetical protein
MAGTIVANTINTDTGLFTTNNAYLGIAKAWVNFNGTGTVAIRDSFNVSSITDNGTGDYTVNFTTAMPNANYSAVLSSIAQASGNNIAFTCIDFDTAPTTTALRVRTSDTSNYQDRSIVNVAVFSS